jgi:hypothetical protein
MAGVVQNDTAALAAGAAVMVALSRALSGKFDWKRWVWVGAALGLGVLFKAGLLALSVVVAAATTPR